MKIALAGAAGNLGKELVECLLADGHSVLALDSNITALTPWQDRLVGLRAVDLRAVDLRRPEQLDGLLDGIEIVITTVGISRPRHLNDFQEVDYQANLNLLNAALAAGVPRFIYTSVARVDSDPSVPLLRAKHAFEDRLKASGISWLILRPSGYFIDIWRTFMSAAQRGQVTLIGAPRQYSFSPIHPGDVARFVCQNLMLADRTVDLGGPEDFTYAEISRLCFELLGQPPRLRVIPLPLFNLLIFFLRLANPGLYASMLFLRWASTTDLTGPHIGERRVRDYLSARLVQSAPPG
jgi:uncharacterized protein YbjT (DUF2867 family)